MNDDELTYVIQTCGGPYQRGMMTGMFVKTDRTVVSWHKTIDSKGREGMILFFPEWFMDAPISVIRDITKAIIQEVCYSSKTELTDDTKEWISIARCRHRQAMEV